MSKKELGERDILLCKGGKIQGRKEGKDVMIRSEKLRDAQALATPMSMSKAEAERGGRGKHR